MKIDKTNPRHWICLTLFGLNVLGAMLLRPFRRRGPKRQVVLYGHRLCGNLLAIYSYLRAHAAADFDVVFLTMDKAYHHRLRADGFASVLATRPQTAELISRVDAVISDHGLHVMQYLVGRTAIKFFDVWHGIPFKGFDAQDFRLQRRYDEVWVASSLLAKLYVERFGFEAERVNATGYARTDRLIRRDEDVVAIKHSLGLSDIDIDNIVLYAPTWKQDSHKRSIYPFDMNEQTFMKSLSELAQRTNSAIVMRTHINSGTMFSGAWERVVHRPFADYPDTEALLLVSDILICDWSSIAFDWLLLDRPTFFLDVPPPFLKGFSLGEGCRYGEVVGGLDTLVHGVEQALRDPRDYWQRYGASHVEIRKLVYGAFADGGATARLMARLRVHLGSQGAEK